MERQVKIFIVVTLVFMLLVGLAFYSAWFKQEKDNANISAIDPNNPLLLEAKNMAEKNMDSLFVLYANYPEHTYVRFPYKYKDAEVQIWAEVQELARDHVSVMIKPGPYAPGFITNEQEIQLSIDRIDDWLVETGSTIRGGFTTQAILLDQMTRQKTNTDSLQQELDRFQDKLSR